MPPTGTNWPAATAFSCTRAYTSGRCSLSQANCWACDMAKTKSGSVVHQRGDVGRRCAPPCGPSRAAATARPSRCARGRPREIRCARRVGRRGQRPRPARSRAAAAVPATSCRSSASSARSSARRISQRRAPSTRQLVHQLAEHLEVLHELPDRRRRRRRGRPGRSRYSGSCPGGVACRRAGWAGTAAVEDHRVRRGLDAAAAPARRRLPEPADAHPAGCVRVEALHR